MVATNPAQVPGGNLSAWTNFISKLLQNSRSAMTGEYKFGMWTESPSNWWLLCNGQTIGSAASGATCAKLIAHDLFIHIWTNVANTYLAILNSDGSAGTRGASAEADWQANKRLPVPDFRGKYPFCIGSAGSGTHLGESGTSENGAKPTTLAHYHGKGTLNITQSGSHNHAQYVTANTGGSGVRMDYDSDGTGLGAFEQGINTGNREHVHENNFFSGVVGAGEVSGDTNIHANIGFMTCNAIIAL